jgi:hypothetical protein
MLVEQIDNNVVLIKPNQKMDFRFFLNDLFISEQKIEKLKAIINEMIQVGVTDCIIDIYPELWKIFNSGDIEGINKAISDQEALIKSQEFIIQGEQQNLDSMKRNLESMKRQRALLQEKTEA